MTRRRALQVLLAGATLRFSRPSRARASAPRNASQPDASSPADRYLRYLAPYPAKRRLLLEGAVHQPEPLLAAGGDTLQPPPLAGARILQSGRWKSGAHPNYSATAVVDGERLVWAACYNSRTVTQVNVTRNTTASFGPFPGIRPLDVAYDAQRRRLVVASADHPNVPREAGQARMIVLDLANRGSIMAELDLALHANQGPCNGGAQGVTIDARGDYWFSLGYSGQLGRGAVIKIDGAALQTSLVVKDLAPNEPIEGLSNPNGIVTGAAQTTVFTFSDTGVAHQFDLDGNLLNRYTTVTTGYRGAVHGSDLWVAAWTKHPGAIARVDLNTGHREIYPCAPLANSVVVDGENRVWVAGDEGLSVSDYAGYLIAHESFGAYLNGLVYADGHVFSTSYAYEWQYEDSMLRFALGKPQVRLPVVLLEPGGAP